MFGKKKGPAQLVTEGRFELEHEGKIAYLKYSLGGGVLELAHTEIPKELRGKGLSSKLAHSALEYARENKLRVDVVCDSVAAYIKQHPEYANLVIK